MENKDTCENRIISLIFTASRNLRQESQEYEFDEAERLSVTQLETLKFIDEQKSSLMKDVAEYLFITPPSLTSLIDGLETRKLVKRDPSKNDRRVILISLTATGKDILKKTMKKKMKRMSHLFEKLTREEQKSLIRILEKLSTPK